MCQTLSAGADNAAGSNRNLWATSLSWTRLSGAFASALIVTAADGASEAVSDGLASTLGGGALAAAAGAAVGFEEVAGAGAAHAAIRSAAPTRNGADAARGPYRRWSGFMGPSSIQEIADPEHEVAAGREYAPAPEPTLSGAGHSRCDNGCDGDEDAGGNR